MSVPRNISPQSYYSTNTERFRRGSIPRYILRSGTFRGVPAKFTGTRKTSGMAKRRYLLASKITTTSRNASTDEYGLLTVWASYDRRFGSRAGPPRYALGPPEHDRYIRTDRFTTEIIIGGETTTATPTRRRVRRQFETAGVNTVYDVSYSIKARRLNAYEP